MMFSWLEEIVPVFWLMGDSACVLVDGAGSHLSEGQFSVQW